jgi:hypothetical protein
MSRGMQALLLTVVALCSVILLWSATLIHSATWKEFLTAVATGLLVSATFGIAQALVTSRVSTEMLRASVVEEVSRSLTRSNNAYFPTNEFPASMLPDPSFNALVSQDLANSFTFWFRGLSGRYAAARLSFNQNVSLQAHLILPDPMAQGTIEGRVEYSLRNQLYPDLDESGIRDRIKHSVALGAVGLFEACRKCAMLEIILTPMPLLDRYEIFRDAIWVTLFSDPGQGMKFPRSLRFPASSILYLMQLADCLQTRAHPNTRVISLPRALTEDDAIRMFAEITGDVITQAELRELREEFAKFAEGFAVLAGIRRSS